MRFLLDEGLPVRLATHLRTLGHDVTAVGHDYPHALADQGILAIATAERRIILTNDKDFGDLIFRDHLPHAGIILFRLGYVPVDVRLAYLERVVTDYAAQLDQFIVVTHRDIRVSSSEAAGSRRRSEPERGEAAMTVEHESLTDSRMHTWCRYARPSASPPFGGNKRLAPVQPCRFSAGLTTGSRVRRSGRR